MGIQYSLESYEAQVIVGPSNSHMVQSVWVSVCAFNPHYLSKL